MRPVERSRGTRTALPLAGRATYVSGRRGILRVEPFYRSEKVCGVSLVSRQPGGLTACGKTHAAFGAGCIPAEPLRFAPFCVAFRSKYTRYSSLTRLVSRALPAPRRSRGFHHRLLTACGQSHAAFERRCIPAEPLRFTSLIVALRSKYTRYSSLARLVSRAPRRSRCSRHFIHRLLSAPGRIPSWRSVRAAPRDGRATVPEDERPGVSSQSTYGSPFTRCSDLLRICLRQDRQQSAPQWAATRRARIPR